MSDVKVRVTFIRHKHPQAASKEFTRKSCELFMTSYDVISNLENGEKIFNEDDDEVRHVLNIRVAMLGNHIGYIIDVCVESVLQEISDWCQKHFAYHSSTPDIRSEHYIAWAKEHKVWP